jgi:acyl carrier protein
VNSDLAEILRTDIRVPDTRLDPHLSLDEAGVDSLAAVELSMLLGDRLGITVDDADIRRVATLGDLDRLVEDKLNTRDPR